MKIDYDFVRRHYLFGQFDFVGNADNFRPAYLMTNENLRKTVTAFSVKMDDVLTVAASGDQALFYALNGAKNIDTFDQTYCAKVIQDVKTTAVKDLSYMQYRRLMNDLFDERLPGNDIAQISYLRAILPAMPAASAEFIRQMDGCNIFGMGGVLDDFDFSENLTAVEYEKVAQNINGPLNFIWTDIADLHMHLTKKYDVINVSNIFEWIEQKNPAAIVPIMKNLYSYLKPGGYLMGVGLKMDSNVDEFFDQAETEIGGGAYASHMALGRRDLAMILRAPGRHR